MKKQIGLVLLALLLNALYSVMGLRGLPFSIILGILTAISVITLFYGPLANVYGLKDASVQENENARIERIRDHHLRFYVIGGCTYFINLISLTVPIPYVIFALITVMFDPAGFYTVIIVLCVTQLHVEVKYHKEIFIGIFTEKKNDEV